MRRYAARSVPLQDTPVLIKPFLHCDVFLQSRSWPTLTVHTTQATVTLSQTHPNYSLLTILYG